jgi:hypothetical protein
MQLRTRLSTFFTLVPLLALPALHGQVITSTVYGVVTDPTGAAVVGAKVTATSEDSGAVATATTDGLGEFTLTSLQAGRYTLQIEAQGFKAAKQSGLELSSGARIRANFQLEVGSVATAVEVTAATPLVNTVNAEQRSNIETQQVRELPTARRDWTGLLRLNTGVTVTGGTVSLNGLAPASFRITVDGTDSASDTELPSLSMYQDFNFIKGVSLEAVEEVNVAKGIASAEIANTMSGNVNINTKRGTNEYHGSLFMLNQTENLNARNQFLTTKPALVYNQFGGSAGGPIVRNKLFAFGVYEGYRLRGFQTLQGNVPTPEFKQQAVAAVPAYKPLMDLFPNPTVAYAPGAVAAQYFGAGSEKGQDNHAIVRGDYHVTSNTIINARYTRGRPFREIPRVAAPNFRVWTGTNEIGSLNVTHSRARWTSETRFGVNFNNVNRLDNLYTLGIPGVSGGIPFSVGGETFFKEGTNYTLEEVIGTTIGRHSLRAGGIYGWLWGGRENIEAPDVGYANAADFLANNPNRVQVTFGVRSYRITSRSVGFFIQDDFKVSRKLVLNLGIRWDYYKVPRERDGRLFNRDEPFGFGKYLPSDSVWKADYNNFSPRIGFAYSVDNESKTVVRGGFGMFQNPRPLFGGPVDIVQNALDEPFRVVYSGADVVRYPEILRYPVVNSKVLPIAKGPSALLGGTAINPNWGYPFSYQWTLSVQRQLLRNTAVEAAYVGTRGLGLMMVRTMNPPDRITGIRPVEGFATFRYRDGSEHTNFHSLQTSVRQRMTANLSFNVNYTWSRNMSYSGDADLLLPASPQDIWNVRADYGPSNIDTRHRFIVDYVYELPLMKLTSSHSAGARMLLRGWQFSGVFTAQTGSPFSVTQPSGLDSSRADYVGGNAILDDANATLQYLNRNAFAQVPLSPVARLPIRPGNAGRNALYGPGFWNIDMTLAKGIDITEKMRMQIRAELLNAFNHTAMSGINSNITQAAFGRFTSTRGARLVQIGARFTF